MRRITTSDEWSYWNSLARDEAAAPFEAVVAKHFPKIVAAGFSSLFRPESISAVRTWSWNNNHCPVAFFFTIPDAGEHFNESGTFGGVVITGNDDPEEIESALFAMGAKGRPISIYDVAHRFIVVPEDVSWIMVGDRDADVALYGFPDEASERAFMLGGPDIVVFESLDDAARYAKGFMNYDLSLPRAAETEIPEQFKRSAALIPVAHALMLRDGVEVLLKFDGQRDNGRLYTLVIGAGRGGQAAFRANASSLEELLGCLHDDDVEPVPMSGADMASQLASLDALARRGDVITLRMGIHEGTAFYEGTRSSVVDPKLFVAFKGPSWKEVAQAILYHQRTGQAR